MDRFGRTENQRSETVAARTSFLARHAWLWLVPLSALLGLLLLEGVLRLLPSLMPVEAHQRLLYLTETGGLKSVADPYLGFVYPPLSRSEFVSHEFGTVVEATDEYGFRNPSPWPEQAEVVIVGDSMAYGYGVAQQESWPTLLDEALPVSRVITLGLPGTVPQQYTRYFERFGERLRPKVLLYMIFPGNDIKGTVEFDQWLAAGSPGNFDHWRYFEGKVPVRGESLLDRSALVMTMRSLRKALRNRSSPTSIELTGGGRLRVSPQLYKQSIAMNRPGTPGFDAVVTATREARERAQALGTQFVVVLAPTKEYVYLPLMQEPFSGLIEPLWHVLTHDEGIAVIDLTEPMRERAARGEQLFFEVDGHPNALGNRVIADYMTQYLRANAQSLGLDDWNQAEPRSSHEGH